MFQNMIPFDLEQKVKYPFFSFMRLRNWKLEKAMLRSMVGADLVIFLSEYARQVIEGRAKGRLWNSVTISHGLSESFRISGDEYPRRPDWLPQNEYLLYVSHLDVYKNQVEVVRGFHLLRQRRRTEEKLLLAGYANSPYAARVRKEISRLQLGNDVILAGNIPYPDLPALYRHAKVNLFASECENCPNILLEALGAGRPLLVSDRPPMPEFGGDAVIYFDPSSPEDFAEKLSSIIDDPNRLMELSKMARLQSLKYDWGETARQTWDAIRRLHEQKNEATRCVS